MSLRLALLAAAVLAAPSAFAEAALDSELPRQQVQLVARAHFGVATTPFEVSGLQQAKGQAFVFHAAARYALSDALSLELGVPWVLGSVAQPAGSYVDAAALGNPELGARYWLALRRSNASVLALDAAIHVGLPLASHAADLLPNRLLAIANGVEGRGRPGWFTPGALPITPSGAVSLASSRFRLEGALELPLLVRVSEADLPEAATDTNPIGFAAVAFLEARYRLSRCCSLALAERLFFDVAPLAAHVGEVSRVQDLERLSFYFHFGSRSALMIDLQTAIGGELGGSMVAGGLRAVVTW
jgi:hypothetical protein